MNPAQIHDKHDSLKRKYLKSRDGQDRQAFLDYEASPEYWPHATAMQRSWHKSGGSK